jgi:ABC-type transport system involved in multi-copper enzyme maturation permease subunit
MILEAAYVDVRSLLRGRAAFVLVAALVLAFAVVALLAFHALGQEPAPVVSYGLRGFGGGPGPGPTDGTTTSRSGLDALTAAGRSAALLVILASLLALCGGVLAAVAGACTIAGEHERETLDLLLTTQLGARGLAVAKLLSVATFTILVVLAALPAFGLLLVFSPLPLPVLALAAGIVLTSVLLASGIGLFYSALTRSTAAAVLCAVGTVLLLFLGASAFYLFLLRFFGDPRVLAQLLLLPSPVAALLSSNYSQFDVPGALLLPALLRASPAHPVHLGGPWQLPVPFWLLTMALDLLATLLLVTLAARALRDPATAGKRRPA